MTHRIKENRNNRNLKNLLKMLAFLFNVNFKLKCHLETVEILNNQGKIV